MTLSHLEQSLLNDFQHDFPLQSHPYQALARNLGVDQEYVLESLARLKEDRYISRIGAVFRPNTIGSSTLAAMRVPVRDLESIAELVNAYPEINHNYERSHDFNLWFVVNAHSVARRDAVIADIQHRTGCPVISLPLVRDYHIDLGFKLDFGNGVKHQDCSHVGHMNSDRFRPDTLQSDFIPALQAGLALCDRPYAALGDLAGMSEQAVLTRIGDLIDGSVIKRFGVVVRHHELGYRSNAMCVWDIPDHKLDDLGERMARFSHVTLCYQRRRSLPEWGYNLFCMIHGKERVKVLEQIDGLIRKLNLGEFPHAVLFSHRRFKQCGALFHRTQTRPALAGALCG